ncbi:hypothetical protein [Pseudomonas putida]
MYRVKYDLPEAVTSFEFLLEQALYGAEVIIIRDGIEVARITATEGAAKRSVCNVAALRLPERLPHAS